MEPEFEGSLKNLVAESDSLKWIFVGGKGGVGKTTTSSSIAVMLSQIPNKQVLIISTDPAHNLSDCFNQKVLSEPTPINGLPSLFAMELDSKIDSSQIQMPQIEGFDNEKNSSFVAELLSSVPGIDEAMGFGQLVKTIEELRFDVIVFDTAPTGHTLKFLNFPSILEKGLDKLMGLKDKLGGFMGMNANDSINDTNDDPIQKLFSQMEKQKAGVEKVNKQMKDPSKTTFVAVCIPEFLSMYETERLVQELAKYQIDIHNIVVNQVLFPDDGCRMCVARHKMQKKYLEQILELYDDMHVVIQPLQEEEVRGIDKLKVFSQMLQTPKKTPSLN